MLATACTGLFHLEPGPAPLAHDGALGGVPPVDLVVGVPAIVVVGGPVYGPAAEALGVSAHTGEGVGELVLPARPAAFSQALVEHHRGDPALGHVVGRVGG